MACDADLVLLFSGSVRKHHAGRRTRRHHQHRHVRHRHQAGESERLSSCVFNSSRSTVFSERKCVCVCVCLGSVRQRDRDGRKHAPAGLHRETQQRTVSESAAGAFLRSVCLSLICSSHTHGCLCLQSMRLKLMACNSSIERRFSSWIGGSILASLVRLRVSVRGDSG